MRTLQKIIRHLISYQMVVLALVLYDGAQILAKYPNLEIKWIRGNIDTRLHKLETENYDAIILAAAGLKRGLVR